MDHVGHFKEFEFCFKFTERPLESFKPGSDLVMIYIFQSSPHLLDRKKTAGVQILEREKSVRRHL